MLERPAKAKWSVKCVNQDICVRMGMQGGWRAVPDTGHSEPQSFAIFVRQDMSVQTRPNLK